MQHCIYESTSNFYSNIARVGPDDPPQDPVVDVADAGAELDVGRQVASVLLAAHAASPVTGLAILRLR